MLQLKRHPDSQCDAVTRIEVEVARPQPNVLVLYYYVTGKVSDLRLASITAPERADELWKHTCFEAFVRSLSGSAYTEFNFAPSRQWAAYRFDGYRSGMTVAGEFGPPLVDIQPTAECFALQAALTLDGLPTDTSLHLGLSAVIEETNGRKSYWALAHPPGKPDFHHADGFALELP